MNLVLRSYNLLLKGIVGFLDCFPPKRIDIEEIALRKGYCENFAGEGQSCIWVHGASLGEVISLRPFLKALVGKLGASRILATATTMDGLRRLRADSIAGRTALLPIETEDFMDRFIDRMKPELVLISETEIWPLFLANLRNRGIPYGIINGRINSKTVKLIKLFWPLFQEGINGLTFVFPQTEVYAARFSKLGINKDRIKVLGGFKFDGIEPTPDLLALRHKFGITCGRKVLCFGSTHVGEEKIILEALGSLLKCSDIMVVLAPRHLKRVEEIERLLDDHRVTYSRLSSQKQRTEHVLLVDTLGDLRNLYALSVLAFVGGSLVPFGGHNILEPASFGVPIISGPYTTNFCLEIRKLRKSNAIFEVADATSLRKVVEEFLKDPTPFQAAGERAKQVMKSLSGAVNRTISVLEEMRLLPKWPTVS